MFLYLLNISLPFHFVYIAVFGVPLLYAGSSWFLFIVKTASCGWGWTSDLSRFPGWGSLHLFQWMELDLFSLECSEVSSSVFWGSRFLAWLWAACLLMLRAVFLLCWRISMGYLALELVGSWVELGFSVDMEAFG